MKYQVLFATTISHFTEMFEDEQSARAAGRDWVKSFLTPGAKKAGETYRRFDANHFAIRDAQGGHPVSASVERI